MTLPFLISLFNVEEIWKSFEIVALFFFSWDKQRSLSTNPEDKLLSAVYSLIWQKQANVDNSACRLIPFT